MRKNINFVLSLAALLFCFVNSCMDERMNEPVNEVKEQLIQDAMRKYYNLSPEEGLVELRSTQEAGDMSVKPLWEFASVHEDKNYQAVEIPLVSEKYFSYATPEAAAKYKETGDRRYRLSKTSFVYLYDKSSRTEDMFMMTIVPELSYTESTRFKPFDKMSYLNRDKSFNGIIFYHNMDGEFVNGWRYTNGKVTHTVRALAEKPDFDVVKTRTYFCIDNYLEYLIEECSGWGYYDNGGEFIENGINCIYYYEYEYWYSVCYDDDPGSGSGGGNGNYQNPVPQIRTDCASSATTNGITINNVLNDGNSLIAAVQPYINQLRGYASSQSNEYGLAVQYASGEYYVYNHGDQNNPQYMVSGTPNGVIIYTTPNSYLMAHTHPNGSNAAPSPLDAIALANAYKGDSPNITANVSFAANGAEYMVFVNNRSALANFCNNPGNSSFFSASGSMFGTGTVWANDYNTAYNNMANKGYSPNDAQSYALSYVLDKYNTGLKVYEKKSGNFKEQNTDVTGSNYLPKICQ